MIILDGYVQVYQYNPGGGEGAGAWEQLGDNILGEANDEVDGQYH